MSKVKPVLDALHDAVVMGDNDCVILQMNRRASAVFGWTSDEVVGKSVSFLIDGHPDEPLDRTETRWARHKRGGTFPVVLQTTRDAAASLVVWTIAPLVLPPTFTFAFQTTREAMLA